MKFSHQSGKPIQGKLSYIDNDKSVDFQPEEDAYRPGNHDPSAALVVSKTLQIEFLVDSGNLLYVWGYLPKESWQDGGSQLSLGEVQPGMIFVTEVDDTVMAGSAYGTDLDSAPTRYFKDSGHLVIGEPKGADMLVEIATDTIVGLKGDQLCCVVLKPIME